MVNVKTFGAAADGVHDDTAAIQAALNYGDPLVQFPPGAYLCNQASPAAWPNWYAAERIFLLPNNPVTLSAINGPVSIVTDKPAILFDCNTNSVALQWLNLKCRSAFNTSGYSFAALVRGNFTCYNTTFIDWTNSIKYLDAPSSNCQNLSINGCIFKYELGIADADPAFGYPSTAILGGASNTVISNSKFDGDKAFSIKPADGLIKTIKQVSNLSINNCDILNYGEEAIACDGENGLSIDIENNRYIPSRIIQGGQCYMSLSGTVTGKIS